MSKKALLGVTGVLVLIGLALSFLNSQTDKVDDALFSFIDSSGLEKIEISQNSTSISLLNDDKLKQWTINSKDNPPLIANADKIVKLLDKINESKILQQVTSKKEHFDRFEVSDKMATVVSIQREGKDDVTLYIGKSKDFSSQFVRKNDESKIYLISQKFDVKTDPDQWMHKKIKLEKQKLSKIHYQTSDRKNVHLNYDASSNKFALKGEIPKKKKLRNLSTLADGLTSISFKGIESTEVTKKGKSIGKHSLTLIDDTVIDYKLIESSETKDSKRYFLSLNVNSRGNPPSPFVEYLASLSKEYVFELYSLPQDIFQKKWDEFFEESKDLKENKGNSKT